MLTVDGLEHFFYNDRSTAFSFTENYILSDPFTFSDHSLVF